MPRRRTVLFFTWAAGCVDAIVYIAGHVFTANMTGNAVLLGISLGSNISAATIRSLIALITFIAGIFLGAVLVSDEEKGIPWKRIRIAVLVETFVMSLFAAVFVLPVSLQSEGTIAALIVLSAFAMGMQSAIVKRLNLPGIATTYITGTMTSLMSGLVHHWKAEKELPEEAEQLAIAERSMALQAWVFILYAVAAVASAVLYRHWPAVVALLPLVAIVAVAISVYVQNAAARS
ncbi:MAG TPA: YoaK family protein [Candidatus Angelobacter sp.]